MLFYERRMEEAYIVHIADTLDIKTQLVPTWQKAAKKNLI